jgi:DNA topoisomerase I
MSKDLIIVESPTKAKTISKFVGSKYTVLSSFGHVRDLPRKEMGIDVEHGFTPTYEVPTRAKTHVSALKRAAKQAEVVYIATDGDREGEAIGWHIAEILKLKPENTKRITFHEITKTAIQHSLDNPGKLDMNLVDAQQARRMLDRLVGYELSPFLWNKVRRGLSAGRVQSVAMRLVVERERERDAFKVDEYWSIEAECEKEKLEFPAKLIKIGEDKLEKLSIKTEADASKIVNDVKGENFVVSEVHKKQMSKNPPKPYTTSSLQIDANNKLSMSAKQTMTLAQKLYETGRITYMRTDSVNLAEKFLTETQEYLQATFGKEYATGANRYKTKKKGAQEAHEAIRPTETSVTPESLQAELEPRAFQLYDLIWRRAVGSQMPAAKINQTRVDMEVKQYLFRANGSTINFDGYMKVYHSAKEKILPELAEKDIVNQKAIKPVQHFTEPPARFSDASLVKVLEEHEIGRPSTYAPTIGTIIDRGYVERDDSKRLFPTDIAKIVNDLLVEHFKDIVDYEFTANLENELDEIAEGKIKHGPMLEKFYTPFHKNLEEKSKELTRDDVMPDRVLGEDKETGLPIIARTGRFGSFIQIGEYTEKDKKDKKPKPKSASLLKDMNIESLTLEQALLCLTIPKIIGKRENGEDITVADGRFGPYVKAGEVSASLRDMSPVEVTLEQAKLLLTESEERKAKMLKPVAELGEDPKTKGLILVKFGRYGYYVTDGITNASIGKKNDPEEVTREDAIELLVKKRLKPVYKKKEDKKK